MTTRKSHAAPTTTRQDDTYTLLHQWITVGRFVPGERLKIRDVAAELGVGTMPVRAALQRLAAQGALVNSPNCGVAVPLLSRADFDDVLQNRLLLEGQAAQLGAQHINPGDKEHVRHLSNTMADALLRNDGKAWLDANEAFHLTLYRAAGSPILLGLIETIWLKVGPLSNQLFAGDTASHRLNDAHDDVVRALDANNPSAVRRAIEKDLLVAGHFLRQHCA